MRVLWLIPAFLLFVSATWMPGDLPPGQITDVAAHPRVPRVAFALTLAGIYRTADGGSHWERVSNVSLYALRQVPVHAFAFNPFNDRDVCALGDFVLTCTADLGQTWSELPQPGINFLLFDPQVSDRMFVGPAYGMDWVFVSNDHGRTWTARGLVDIHPWFHGSAAVDPGTDAVLETASPHGVCIPFCSIFRSDDAGATWRVAVDKEDQWSLAADRSGRSVLYVVVGDSISASGDLGATLAARGQVPIAVTALASDPANIDVIYAAGDAGILYRSEDGGRNWSRIDQSQIGDRIAHISVGADGILYVATDNRVFVLRSLNRRRAVPH